MDETCVIGPQQHSPTIIISFHTGPKAAGRSSRVNFVVDGRIFGIDSGGGGDLMITQPVVTLCDCLNAAESDSVLSSKYILHFHPFSREGLVVVLGEDAII